MTLNFEKISQNNRYGYARVSSREQAKNSSLDAQKAELIKLVVESAIQEYIISIIISIIASEDSYWLKLYHVSESNY